MLEGPESTIRLGGIKVIENRAYLRSSCLGGGDDLASICSILAVKRINLGLLIHIAETVHGESITAASAGSAGSFFGYTLEKSGRGDRKTVEITTNISRISVFPHNQRPEIAASLLALLDAHAITLYGLASSPSAITIVVSASDFDIAMESIFNAFAFPTCTSYSEWRTVRRMTEQLLSEVRCSYSEQVITIYGFSWQAGLDLWNVSVPIDKIGRVASFVTELGEIGLKLPFMVSGLSLLESGIHFSFALKIDLREKVGQSLDKHLPGRGYLCRGPVTALFVHGPHFGDRYGIANTFVTALRQAGIPLFALSCAVSSISAVIAGNDPGRAVAALNTRF